MWLEQKAYRTQLGNILSHKQNANQAKFPWLDLRKAGGWACGVKKHS